MVKNETDRGFERSFMAEASAYKPEIKWDQTAFEALRATWSPERIAEDEKTLEKIFRMAEDSPQLMEELEWARQHGIKFFIDHTAVNCGGYYWPGSGVMAISAKQVSSPAFTVEILAHELRHAWQDYHGLLAWNDLTPSAGNFAEFSIKNALAEADALAYGQRASFEFQSAQYKKIKEPVPAYIQKALSDENADLGEKFLSWFGGWHSNFYGDFFSIKHGVKWGVYDGAFPTHNFEHHPVEPQLSGLNIDNIQDVLQLGVNFSGTKNYLAQLQRDILPKQILRPSLANAFWGVANDKQKKLTTELRKVHLRQKLAPENKRKYHPWP